MGSIVNLADGEALKRAERFAKAIDKVVYKQLGAGADGVVVSTEERTAIKALRFYELYQKERDAYFRRTPISDFWTPM